DRADQGDRGGECDPAPNVTCHTTPTFQVVTSGVGVDGSSPDPTAGRRPAGAVWPPGPTAQRRAAGAGWSPGPTRARAAGRGRLLTGSDRGTTVGRRGWCWHARAREPGAYPLACTS